MFLFLSIIFCLFYEYEFKLQTKASPLVCKECCRSCPSACVLFEHYSELSEDIRHEMCDPMINIFKKSIHHNPVLLEISIMFRYITSKIIS